jgi:hypothetical protein
VWKGKPCGLAGVGPQSYEGAHGGLLAAVALRQSGMYLEWKLIDTPRIHVLNAPAKFTATGELKEEVHPLVCDVNCRKHICGQISREC